MFILAASSTALAQDDSYVPPPMFEDDQVRPKSDTGNIVEPRASSMDSVKPAPPLAPTAPTAVQVPQQPKFMQPIVEGKPDKPEKKTPVVKKPKKPEAVKVEKPEKSETPPTAMTAAPVPVPPKKPMAPVKEATKPEEDKPSAPTVKAPAPASKVTSEGVVTGPKTMPAVPTQTVEQQVLDLTAPIPGAPTPRGPEELPEGETIMERHQHQVQSEQKKDEQVQVDENIAAAMANNVTPAEFESDKAQKVLKKILPFQPGQIELTEPDLLSIGAGIMKELNKRDHWRIQIRSFASSDGKGINADKRIALSRAIALRKSLVKQGVRPSRIDVRAEGNLPAPVGESSDRVDVYLYSPVEKPEIF